MKKYILIGLSLLFGLQSFCQSCAPPACGVSFNLSGGYTSQYINNFNNTARGVTCFNGDGSVLVITQAMQLANITTFVFQPNIVRYQVNQVVNLQNHGKVYVKEGADVTLTQLSLNGGDTLFVAGVLNIDDVTNVNNSTSGNRAVILITGNGMVRIEAQPYVPGQTFINVENPQATNQIDVVRGCEIVTPLIFGEIKVEIIKQ